MKLNTKCEIINGISHGRDREVLDLLYKKLLPKLKSYVLKNRGTADDVKDLFQDILYITYRKVKLEGFSPDGDIINYMFVSAKNNWIRKAVKEQRNNSLDDNTEEFVSTEIGALYSLIINEKEKAAQDILGTIGERCAELLNLRIHEEFSLDEIVSKMGFSNIDVVKTTIYRCKQKLKDKIKKNKGFQDLLGIKLT